MLESDNAFEQVCASMEDKGISNPENLPEFKFYHRLEFLREQAERHNSAGSKEFHAE